MIWICIAVFLGAAAFTFFLYPPTKIRNTDIWNKRKEPITVEWADGTKDEIQYSEKLAKAFRCKCGYETNHSVDWCCHADCCTIDKQPNPAKRK